MISYVEYLKRMKQNDIFSMKRIRINEKIGIVILWLKNAKLLTDHNSGYLTQFFLASFKIDKIKSSCKIICKNYCLTIPFLLNRGSTWRNLQGMRKTNFIFCGFISSIWTSDITYVIFTTSLNNFNWNNHIQNPNLQCVEYTSNFHKHKLLIGLFEVTLKGKTLNA